MLQLWHKQPDVVYVPVAQYDVRPYQVKWSDRAYLEGVRTLGSNTALVSECSEALRALRDHADRAETPEMLKGCNCGIAIIKGILTASERAASRLESMREPEGGANEHTDSTGRP